MDFKFALQVPLKAFWGNVTYISQIPMGGFCFCDGVCSLIDAGTCINPVAKPLFIAGGVSNILAGTAMIASFGVGTILFCLPGAVALGVAGTCFRKAAKYSLAAANTLEVKPTLTKFMAPIGAGMDFVDNPVAGLF